MSKRMISLILAVCILFACAAPVLAESDEYPKREYYNIKITHTTYYETDNDYSVDFMVLTDSETSKQKVYIKAEDFSEVTIDAGYQYEYNQTYTECAFVSFQTSHVVRFMLNSSNVSVFYACDDISYTAPYDTLYEDGVTWLPFEFAVKLLYMQAVPVDNYIHLTSTKYNPLAVTSVIHENIRDYGYDELAELGRSELSYNVGRVGATLATACNKLLSFEPTAWASTLSCIVGNSTMYDATFAEDIGSAFVLPSEQEIEKTDTFLLKKFAGSTKAYDKLMLDNIITGTPEKKANMSIDKFNELLKKHPKLSKLKAVENIKDLVNDPNSKKAVNNIFVKLGHFYDHGGEKATKIAGGMVEAIKLLDYYKVYKNKSDRSVSALKQYVSDTKYEEKFAFEYCYASAENPFIGYITENITDKAESAFNDGMLKFMGPLGAQAKTMGVAWNFVSGIGPLKSGISATEKATVSDYAVRYQDECLGIYYDYYSKCIAENGANEESLEKMLNALYAYMKFAYIARNSAAASHKECAEALLIETKNINKENATKAAEYLNKRNEPIAEFLTYMEQEIFTPTDAAAYAKNWDDDVFAEALRINGKAIERPTQDTVPVFEFPEFPGAKGVDYINEEEAIKLAKKTTDRLTGGMLNSDLVKMMTESMGAEEIYTYQHVGNYVNGKDMAYVVQMSTNGNPDALYFVSVVGNEVWMGNPAPDEPGGYYVYTDLDLLHANMGDLIGAIGGLTGELMKELKEENSR